MRHLRHLLPLLAFAAVPLVAGCDGLVADLVSGDSTKALHRAADLTRAAAPADPAGCITVELAASGIDALGDWLALGPGGDVASVIEWSAFDCLPDADAELPCGTRRALAFVGGHAGELLFVADELAQGHTPVTGGFALPSCDDDTGDDGDTDTANDVEPVDLTHVGEDIDDDGDTDTDTDTGSDDIPPDLVEPETPTDSPVSVPPEAQ